MLKLLGRFVDSNERETRRLLPTVDRINALEPDLERLSDEGLAAKTAELRARLEERVGEILVPLADRPGAADDDSALAAEDATRRAERLKEQRQGELARINAALDEVLPEAFAAVREASRRALGKRHYDVQLMGGMVLHAGRISEMKTGEGKTLVAPLAAYLNALTGRGVHIVTPNDYLAKRDAQWMGQIFHRLRISVSSIQHDRAFLFDPEFPATDERLRNLRPITRREA